MTRLPLKKDRRSGRNKGFSSRTPSLAELMSLNLIREPRFSPRAILRRAGVSLALASAGIVQSGCIIVAGGRDHDHEMSREISFDQPLSASALRVRNPVGEVTVVADPSATGVTARATLIGRGSSEENAIRALEEIAARFEPAGDDALTAEAWAEWPSASRHRSYVVEWVLTAPPELAVRVSTDVGAIEVTGFEGPARLETDVGDIRALELTGGLTARTEVGEVRARAAAPLDISTDVGDAEVVVLPSVPSPISVRTNVGEIVLSLPESWAGDLDAKCDTGDIVLSNSGFASLSLERMHEDRVRAKIGQGGPAITLVTDVGDVEIRSAK